MLYRVSNTALLYTKICYLDNSGFSRIETYIMIWSLISSAKTDSKLGRFVCNLLSIGIFYTICVFLRIKAHNKSNYLK